MRRAALTIVIALALASSTHAAPSPSRDAARGEATLRRAAACLFECDQAKIVNLMISWPGSQLEQNTIEAMNRRLAICMPFGSRLLFAGTLLRGVLAEQALLRQFAAPAPLPALPVGWAREPLGNSIAPPLGALHAFGRCVVLAAPERADALARTARGSAEEGAAIEALGPALPGCVDVRQRFTLDRSGLRGLLAEALLAALNRDAGAPIPRTLHAIYWPPRN
jgi:hypothetical protein